MITMKEICISQGSAVTFFRCGGQIHNHVCLICAGFCVPKFTKLGYSFWATVSKTVRPMLSDRCLPCSALSVCDVGVLWRNGWMDQDETWHGGRPRPRPHCIRWGPTCSSSLPKRGNFRPMSLVAKRLDGSRCHLVGILDIGPGDIVLDGVQLPSPKKVGTALHPLCFWLMSCGQTVAHLCYC